MTGKEQIDYAALTQEAFRGIVHSVLLGVAASGLPGDHHFFIAFDTRAPGVVVPKRLRERYPEEMTIVLQHQFSRLVVDDEHFEVTLRFDNIPERLSVPLKAVRRFFDPSVQFIIHFEGSDLTGDLEPKGTGRDEPARPDTVRVPRQTVPLSDDVTETPGADPDEKEARRAPRRQGARPKLVASKSGDAANDANVVELDKFRKK
jgi:hypothetical protein